MLSDAAPYNDMMNSSPPLGMTESPLESDKTGLVLLLGLRGPIQRLQLRTELLVLRHLLKSWRRLWISLFSGI